MRSQDSALCRLSPPLVARSLARLAICSGQSHPGVYTQPKPPRERSKSHRSRAIRSPDRHGLWASPRRPRLSFRSHRMQTCGEETHPLSSGHSSRPTIDTSDTSASRARGRLLSTSASQPAPKTAPRVSPVTKTGNLFGPKYRATHEPCESRALCVVVGRARAICPYLGRSVFGRSVGGRPSSPVGRCS